MSKQVLAEPELIEAAGGWEEEYFLSYVPRNYSGMCAMRYHVPKGRQYWAIFTSRKAAIDAASVASRLDIGGYHDVSIHPVASGGSPNHFRSGLDWLFSNEQDFEPPKPLGRALAITQRLMKELARAIAENPLELAEVEWRDLERLLDQVLKGLGYDTTLTPSSKDGGYDLEIRNGDDRILVELKHWSAPSRVGGEIIERFAEVVVRKAAKGILLSSSGFTADVARARLDVIDVPVILRLGDDRKVIQLCRYFVENEKGLWIPGMPLQSLLFEDTFQYRNRAGP